MTHVILAGGITVLIVTLFLLWLGLKAQKKINPIGNEAMIGETCIVRKTAGFRNRIVVEVRGENWWARLPEGKQATIGEEARVTGIDPTDMMLLIEPVGRG